MRINNYKLKIFEALKIIILLCSFFYATFVCKNFLDNSPEIEFNKSFFADSPNKLITQLMLLNKNIAISQFYQFQMIAYYTSLDIPHGSCSDGINELKTKIQKKYVLTNIDEYFDIDKYYKLMAFSLEFDPKNEFTRMFGMHLSLNYAMMQKAIEVLEKVYKKFPSWDYAFDIGWLNFYCLRDYNSARKWFKITEKFSDAPRTVLNMYNATLILENKYEAAIISTQKQLLKTNDPRMKNILKDKLDWFRAMDLLIKKSFEYKKLYGKNISDIQDLVNSKLLSQIPNDSLGEGFFWDSDLKEPYSKGNPFLVIKNKNPIAIEKIDVDDSKEEIAKKVGNIFR